MGGAAFSVTMAWAQAMPFVALQLYEGENKSLLTVALVGSFTLWLVLNVVFFLTIDLRFLRTFFTTVNGPDYTCRIFHTTVEDCAKFQCVFTNRLQFTESIEDVVKIWVGENIEQWKREDPD